MPQNLQSELSQCVTFYQTTSCVHSISYQILQIPFGSAETVVTAKSALNSSNKPRNRTKMPKKFVICSLQNIEVLIHDKDQCQKCCTVLLFLTACFCPCAYPYCLTTPTPLLRHISRCICQQCQMACIGTVKTTAKQEAKSCIQIASKKKIQKIAR